MLDGELLRDRRIAASLSIRAVAEQSGIPAQTLRALEAGRQAADRQLTLASLERLTRLLDVDTGELFARRARAATSGWRGWQAGHRRRAGRGSGCGQAPGGAA